MKNFGLNIKYPQNYLIKRPLTGAFILFVFSFCFTLLYHPLNTHKSFYFSFEITMLVYTLSSASTGGLTIYFLKKIPFFSKVEKWTLGKELISIYIILQTIGIAIYFLAFFIEPANMGSRWNFATFLNSSKYSFLINIFPFAFFSAINYKFLFLNFEETINAFQDEKQQVLSLKIRSKLKKESLTFTAGEFLFAVSQGNYVVFHLYNEKELKKIPIRNSIADIDDQFKDIPYFFRCHRGFIVNLNMVVSKKGNASGYLLKLKHSADVVPVSRKYAHDFSQIKA